jgi:hypothetical protein
MKFAFHNYERFAKVLESLERRGIKPGRVYVEHDDEPDEAKRAPSLYVIDLASSAAPENVS